MSCERPYLRFEVPYKVRGYLNMNPKPYLDKIYPETYALFRADGSIHSFRKVHNGAVMVRCPVGISPQLFRDTFSASHVVDFVPCGTCPDCRFRARRELTYRLVKEYDDYYLEHDDPLRESVLFVTLTYDDDHIVFKKTIEPFAVRGTGELVLVDAPTLVKAHVQKFLKDLRSWLDYHADGLKVRFFVAGEYGPKTLRPHYHMIVYGLPDTLLRLYGVRIWSVSDHLFTSDLLSSIWGRGRVVYGIANFATMQYCAGYVLKKMHSFEKEADTLLYYIALHDDDTFTEEEREPIFKEFRGKTILAPHPSAIEPEFQHGSRRPGLGRGYFEKYKEEIMRDDAMTIVDGYGNVRTVQPAAYYDRIYDAEHRKWDNVPSRFRRMQKSFRIKKAQDRLQANLTSRNMTLTTYLQQKQFISRSGFAKVLSDRRKI